MPIKQIDHGTKEYTQMVELRKEILRRPLGLTFDAKELEREKDDILIAALEEDKMLGCCLLTKVDNQCVRLRQMAVQNNLQGKGIGATMMNYPSLHNGETSSIGFSFVSLFFLQKSFLHHLPNYLQKPTWVSGKMNVHQNTGERNEGFL
jgi:hypothetical protein